MTEENPETPPRKRPRGIYLLPNLFTTAALFAGFYAIVAATGDRFEAAAIAIFIAMVMDGVDGRVARLTNTQSDFGVQYDSLSDMVSFGLAPALVMYEWSLHSMATYGWIWAKIGWLGAFVYTASAALRLARFNSQVEVADKHYFQGLPSPSAAAVVAGMVWLGADADIAGPDVWLPALLITTFAGILMVSNLRYYSFKEVDFKNRVPFVVLLIVVMLFIFVSIDPPTFLFAGFLLYVLSGPVVTIWRLRQRQRQRKAASGQDKSE